MSFCGKISGKLSLQSPNLRSLDFCSCKRGQNFHHRYYFYFDQYNWNNIDAELILIELNIQRNKSSEWHITKTQYEEIMTVMNTQSRWRTHPIGMSMIKYLFPEKTIKMIHDAIDKDKRITKMGYAIREEQWEKLGRISSNGLIYYVTCFPLYSINNCISK